MQKMGWFGVVRGTQGHGQCHHSIERIRLPIRISGLSCSVVFVILRLAVLVELRLVTYRQTEYVKKMYNKTQ